MSETNAVAHRDEAAPAPVSETAAIIQVIERAALNPNVDIDKMERLLQMQERIVARNAKAAYAAAFAEMQPELPIIAERGEIKIGGGNSKGQKYALWEDINEAIKPVLARHGFGISFRTGRQGDRLTVTGILTHREGHSEETTLELPADSTGSKNAVQAVGSSTSYGKRYTAQALLNLTSRGEDDDGKAAGAGEAISEDQLDALLTLADDVGADKMRFCRYFKVGSFAEIPARRFEEAKTALEHKRRRS